jgi:hypothetical protein
MPTDARDVQIYFRASNVSDGLEDVSSELTLATADNIGAVNLPTVVRFSPTSSGFLDTSAVFTTANTVSGSEDVPHSYYLASTTTSGYLSKEISYSTGQGVTSGTVDLVSFYFTPDVLGSGTQNILNDFIVGQLYSTTEDIAQQYWIPIVYSGTNDYEVDMVGGFKIPFYKDAITALTKSASSSGTLDANVDLTFTGFVFHDVPMDIFSTALTASGLAVEATSISGAVHGIGTDVFASLSDLGAFLTDTFCSLESTRSFETDAMIISGTIDNIVNDIFCTGETKRALTCDIDLFPMKISNFSLGIGQWDYATTSISVDITDDVYAVTTSGCYFLIDGQQVSVTTSGITDGIRIFYDPANDFADLEGSTTITAHGENDNGDVIEQDFYVTFGYVVEYKNYERFGWNYGQGEQIVVRMSAENLANCPEFSADAYWFETREVDRRELTASITGIYNYDGSENLTASIYPQSTAYFYGKVFRVKLTAKDLAGNEMEPFEFEFKIEEKPE